LKQPDYKRRWQDVRKKIFVCIHLIICLLIIIVIIKRIKINMFFVEIRHYKHPITKSNTHLLKSIAMETRKTKKSDLEKKRPVFLQLGLIISLAAAITAFEWKTPELRGTTLPTRTSQDVDVDLVPIVTQKKELPKPVNTTMIKSVEDIRENIPEIKVSAEIDPDAIVMPYFPPLPETEDPEVVDNTPFVVVEEMPVFPGGEAALMQYLAKNTVYPKRAKEAGISGTVYVTFVVEPDGLVSSIGVLREVTGGCTEEAIRVVSEMPRWKPGKQRGKAVRVRMNLPISFKLIGN
jgi:protein TonB